MHLLNGEDVRPCLSLAEAEPTTDYRSKELFWLLGDQRVGQATSQKAFNVSAVREWTERTHSEPATFIDLANMAKSGNCVSNSEALPLNMVKMLSSSRLDIPTSLSARSMFPVSRARINSSRSALLSASESLSARAINSGLCCSVFLNSSIAAGI